QLVAEEGLGLDVVSGGELYTALAAGFPAERIILHGNNKTEAELRQALEAGVGRIVVDNFSELERLTRLAAGRAEPVPILLRVVPGVEAHTHEYIDTGRQDTKFGFDIAAGQALTAVERTLARPDLKLMGLHCHIGSQIFDLQPYRLMVDRLFAFAAEARRRSGWQPAEVNLGGGLGVRYQPEDEPPGIETLVRTLVEGVRAAAGRHGLPVPRLMVEPGRSIVGEAGVTLYTVGSIKRLEGVRTYVAVDGGMMENPRPALYGARYTALLITPPGSPAAGRRPAEKVAVVGRACESGDILVSEAVLPEPREGDFLALLTTGAYTYSMASHYNKFPRPAVVLVAAGRARIMVERERHHDLIRRERPLHGGPRVAPLPTRAGRLRRDPQAPAGG
ncbi:MAG TPA: diaminopimelate decarboxylase, partial [Bacillota bacterium]